MFLFIEHILIEILFQSLICITYSTIITLISIKLPLVIALIY
jgi:hypothetical protein